MILEADLEDKNPISNLLKPVPAARIERDYTILSKPVVDPAVFKKLKYENSTMKERLEQAVHLADMYREQCIAAEEEVSKIRDEIFNNKTMFQDRTGKLVDKLELTTKVNHWYDINSDPVLDVNLILFSGMERSKNDEH